jgi:hypothetical protein
MEQLDRENTDPKVSNCCGAPVDEDILICFDCKEHCEAVDTE